MASDRMARSRDAGMRVMSAAPAAGRNTAKVIALWSQPVTRPPSQPGDHERQDGHAGEQEHGVALDIAGLEVPQDPAQRPRAEPDPVDRAVHDRAVEAVHPAGDRVLARLADAFVTQAVEVVRAR